MEMIDPAKEDDEDLKNYDRNNEKNIQLSVFDQIKTSFIIKPPAITQNFVSLEIA